MAKSFEELKEEVDNLQRAADRARGAYNATMKTLEEEFGTKTLADAEAHAAKLEKAADKAKKEAEKAKAQFEKEWADVLE